MRTNESLHISRPSWLHRSRERTSPSSDSRSRSASRGRQSPSSTIAHVQSNRKPETAATEDQPPRTISNPFAAIDLLAELDAAPGTQIKPILTSNATSVDPIPDPNNHNSVASSQSRPTHVLWERAMEKLRSENRELVTFYENLLKTASGGPDSASLNEQMQAVVNSRLQEMELSQWRIRVGGTDIKLRDQLERIIGLVSAVRDIGSSVAALDPVHAGIPWAGVCVLLSAVVNSSDAKAATATGLEKIAIIVARYGKVETLYLSSAGENDVTDLRDAIVGLYADILSYQIEVARHLMRNSFKRFAIATFQLNDWSRKLQNVQDADEHCKQYMALCDKGMTATAMSKLHQQLAQLDEHVNRRIADIMTSQSIVYWDPGPNTNPEYVTVLYGGFQARAGFYQISLIGINTDETLIVQLRPRYVERQHVIRVALGWLIWFSVTRLEFVKYKIEDASQASYVQTGETPVQRLLPMQRWIHAWHHPHGIGHRSDECLKELKAVIASPEQWGILIVEDFEIVHFSISMTIAVGLALVMHMITEDFGREIVGSLRAGFIGIFASVILFGVLSHPAYIDKVRVQVNARRMSVLVYALVAGVVMDLFGSMMETFWRRALNGLVVIGMLAGLFYGTGWPLVDCKSLLSRKFAIR